MNTPAGEGAEEVAGGECRGRDFRAAWTSDVGNVRLSNEDAVKVLPELGLLILSDGMGGEYGGRYASEIVVGRLPIMLQEELDELTEPSAREAGEALRHAVLRLNQFVRQESTHMGEPRTMGATVEAVLVRGTKACIAHMGDSRVYRWRTAELERLTTDHSVVGSLIQEGMLTERQARFHPMRGQLRRFIGMGRRAGPDLSVIDWEHDEWLLLCSDGLTDPLLDEEIEAILNAHQEINRACRRLVETAKKAGGTDNVSVLIAERS